MGTKLLLAIPVLIALAIASISPAPPAAAVPPAPTPTTAPQRVIPAPAPPVKPRSDRQLDDTCVCPQRLLWEECEPAWHQDLAPDDKGRRSQRRTAPGTQDGPI